MAECDIRSADLKLVVQPCPWLFDFALQFEYLIFGILPSSIILVASVLSLVASRHTARAESISRDSATKQSSSRIARLSKFTSFIILIALQFSTLVEWAATLHPRPSTAIPSAVLSFLATSLLAYLSYLNARQSVGPQTLIECSLFFTILFEAVQLRSYWLRAPGLRGFAVTTSASLAARLFALYLESRPKRQVEHRLIGDSTKYPIEPRYGIFGRVSFWWLNSLFISGWKSTIPLHRLWSVDAALSSRTLASAYSRTKSCNNKFFENYSLAVKCLRICLVPLRTSAITRFGLLACTYAQPFLIERVVQYLENRSRLGEHETDIGRGLVGATAAIYFFIAVTTAHYKHQVYRAITMIRGTLVLAIYQKILLLDETNDELASAVTLMSTDVERIASGLEAMHEIWAGLLGTVIGCTVMGFKAGVSVTIPVVLVIISFTATTFLIGPNGRAQRVWNEAIQKRVSVTSSTLTAMRFIKMCGLSPVFESVIQSYRIRELKKSKRLRRLTAIGNVNANIPEFLAPVLALIMMWALRPQAFTVSNVLATVAMIVLLTDNLAHLITAMTMLKIAFTCFGRIQTFLDLPNTHESHPKIIDGTPADEKTIIPAAFDSKMTRGGIPLGRLEQRPEPRSMCCSIQDGVISPNLSTFQLGNINVNIPMKSVTMVIGPVACGKSLLLKSITGEVDLARGAFTRPARGIAYCAQAPFIWKASLRTNILGESGWDAEWYQIVIEACAVKEVISQLPQGDATNVGNRGSMLSGGQQSRLSLARAVYSRQPLLVMDDPLSGLDRRTQAFVLEHLLGTDGLCRKMGLTVIMATSHIAHVRCADQIISVGHAGSSVQTVRPEDLQDIEQSPSSSKPAEILADSPTPSASPPNPPFKSDEEDDADVKVGRGSGDIQLYLRYVRSMGYLCAMTFVVLAALFVFFIIFPQKWAQLWAQSHQHHPATTDNTLYIGVYVMSAVVGLAVVGTTIGYWFIVAVPRSATSLHLSLLQTVMAAPYSWLLNTNTGKTLNRFSQDMSLVDQTLPTATILTVIAAFNCIGSLVFVVLGSAWLAVSIPAFIGILYVIQSIYLRTSRQLRLLDLEAKSPLYTHYGETIDGLATIRAFGWQAPYVERGMRLLDLSQSPFYLLYCVQRWLNFVLDMMVAGIATLLVGVAIALKGTSTSDSGSVGVALVNIIQFSQNLTMLVQFWTAMETSLGAIARVAEMVHETPREALDGEDQDASAGLLEHAPGIEFRDVSVKAVPESTSFILKHVNLKIRPGNKTAIVGPSGSGKSSLFLALTRLLYIQSGQILLDGKDITSFKRDSMRQKISIMSQDPPTLPGTARFNLDSLGLIGDPQLIMAALAKVGLDSKLEEQGGIEAEFADISLSAGEKQLFRLAAVLLNPSKLVLLDEVTSNLDLGTEESITRMIEEELGDRTILAIAHRLSTVMNFDQVIVVESSNVVEIGNPRELLEGHG